MEDSSRKGDEGLDLEPININGMGGQEIWCLLALIAVQPCLIVSKDSCASERQQLVLQICSLYSCRDKCNLTTESLRESGTQQMCHCDDRCVMFDDCCQDFPHMCAEVEQDGLRKYTKYRTNCVGGVRYILDWEEKQTERKVTDMSTISIETSAVTDSTSLGTSTSQNETSTVTDSTSLGTSTSPKTANFESLKWTEDIHRLLQLKVDKSKRLVIVEWIADQVGRNHSFNWTNVEWIQVSLRIPQRFTYIGNMEDIKLIQIKNIQFPQRLERSCKEKRYFQCPNCHLLDDAEFLCSEGAAELSSTSFDVEEEHTASCQLFRPNSSPEDRYYFTRAFAFSGGESLPYVFILSELPWSIFRCTFQKCTIESCSRGRVLSMNGQDCFIPVRINLRFQFNSEISSKSSASPSPEMQDHKPAAQNDLSRNTTEHSPGICIYLYRVLYPHTEWALYSISVNKACIIHFHFKHSTKAPAKKEIWENLKRYIDKQNLKKNLNLETFPIFYGKHDNYGLDQAWNLIHKDLHSLNIVRLELCLESNPKQPCFKGEKQESCGNRASRCAVHELTQTTTAAADKMFSPHPQYSGLLCMSCGLTLLLFT